MRIHYLSPSLPPTGGGVIHSQHVAPEPCAEGREVHTLRPGWGPFWRVRLYEAGPLNNHGPRHERTMETKYFNEEHNGRRFC
jgi:hypothetical protein